MFNFKCNIHLNKHYTLRSNEGVEDTALHILNLCKKNGSKWSASRPSCFTLKKTAPSIHIVAGWIGPTEDFRENPLSLPRIETQFCGHTVCGLITVLTVLSKVLFIHHTINNNKVASVNKH